jgi:uncharacterized damage-inducible protein DinB
MQSLDYHNWANEKFFERLYELPRETIYQELQSVFPTLFSVMTHIYMMDITWFYAMREDSFEQVSATIAPLFAEINWKTLEELQQKYQELSEKYTDLFSSQEDIERVLSIQHPQWGTLNTSFSELSQHVSNHGTYHRGNLTAMLRQMGLAGVKTDYIFYLFARANITTKL